MFNSYQEAKTTMEQLLAVKAQTLSEFIEAHFDYGVRTSRKQEAAQILFNTKRVQTFNDKCKRNEIIKTQRDTLYKLADEWELTDKEKFVGAVVALLEGEKFPIAGSAIRGSANCGSANHAEIEVERWSENILADPKYMPANQYVEVYVDDVCFRQEDMRNGTVLVKEGKYIWIQPASRLSGAVVLPVDVESGDVLLVSQYRHPQRKFLTEVPRGFGMLGVDLAGDIDTGRRELGEETGAVPLIMEGAEELHFLRRLYTDTGKLWERPSYYLAYVNRQLQYERLNRREPTMEDPVWVTLRTFYEAVLNNEDGVPISEGHAPLNDGKFEFALNEQYREKLNAHIPLQDGFLKIEDAFTTQAAFFAYRRLKRKYPKLVPDLG